MYATLLYWISYFFGSCNIKSGNILTWQTPGRNLQAIDTLFPSWQADGNPRLVYKGNFNKSSLSTSPYPSLYSLDIWVFLHSARNQIIFYIFFRGDDFSFFLRVAAWLTDCVNKPNTHTHAYILPLTRIDKSMWKFININFSERQLTIDPQSSSTIGIIHSTSAQIAPF